MMRASRYPIAPQMGKVSVHAESISKTIRKSTPLFLQSPHPIMAHALECVVLAGIPSTEQMASTDEDAASDALPPAASSSVMSQPTFLMIRAPPSMVPSVMTAAQISTTDRGMEFAMPGEYSTFEFFGLGPFENYCDRSSSALMGHYVQRVQDQYHYGYVRPQESGTKTQLKWIKVLDDNGAGFEITSDVKFSASALPFHWKEMDVEFIGNRQAHSLELKKLAHEDDRSLGKTWVNFDLKQMGLGCVDSWGAWPRLEHLVVPQEYTFRFVLRPVNN